MSPTTLNSKSSLSTSVAITWPIDFWFSNAENSELEVISGASLTAVTIMVKVCVSVKLPSLAVIVISPPSSPSSGVPDKVLPLNANHVGNVEVVIVTSSPSTSEVVIS